MAIPCSFAAAIISALIGGFASIIGILLRDFWARKYFQSSEAKRAQESIFQLYADPLSRAAESLVWRCSELLDERYDSFFVERVTWPYIEYKRVSTVFRFASLLGWITAYQREISFLRAASNETPLQEPINALRSALADGPHVEEQRLINVLRPMNHDIKKIKEDHLNGFTKVASRLDNNLKRELNEQVKSSARELPTDSLTTIHEKLKSDASELLELKLPSSPSDNLSVLLDQKEAWLYRDWQTAIGDNMLKKIAPPISRRFEMKEYSDFESDYEDKSNLALERLKAIFTGLEPTKRDPSDARINQFRATARAVAELFLTLRSNDPKPLMRKAQLKAAELIMKIDESSDKSSLNTATKQACKILLTWKESKRSADKKWIEKARSLSTKTKVVASTNFTVTTSTLR